MESNVFGTGKKLNNKVLLLIYILCPIGLYLLVYLTFKVASSYPAYVNHYYGLAIGCSNAVLVHISFAITGILKPYIGIEIRRTADFFFDLKVSPKYAFSQLFTNIKEEGMWLYALSAVTIVCIVLSVIGFAYLFELYNIVI